MLAEIYDAADYDAAIESARAAQEPREQVVRMRRVFSPPADWSGKLRIQPCPKHDKPRRAFAAEVMSRMEAGYDDIRPQVTFNDVTWTSLAASFRRARPGETVEETIG